MAADALAAINHINYDKLMGHRCPRGITLTTCNVSVLSNVEKYKHFFCFRRLNKKLFITGLYV